MRKIIFWLLSFCLCPIFLVQARQELTDSIFPRTDPIIAGKIYYLLSVFDHILSKHHISYWIIGGTLLGAVRHRGLIPWDDDADVEIYYADKKRLFSLNREFFQYGCELIDSVDCIKLYFKGNANPDEPFPFVDVFTSEKNEDGLIILRVDDPNKKTFVYSYWTEEELSSIQKVPFGPLYLNAVKDPFRHLFADYSFDVMHKGTFFQHLGNKMMKEKVRITDFSSAKYTLNNLQILKK